MARRTIDNVQALRALAAILVVLKHIDLVQVGTFGVDIFFTISGFVIAFVGSAERPGIFALKRIFRVVPLYWLATLAVFALAWFFPHLLQSTTADPDRLARSLLFIPFEKRPGVVEPTLFMGWTLNYEMLFYLFFGIGLALQPHRVIAWTTVAIGALVVLGILFRIQAQPLKFWTQPIMLEFVSGAWLFHVWKTGKLPALTPPIALAVIGALVLLSVWCESHLGNDLVGGFDRSGRFLIFGLPALIIVFCGLGCEGLVKVPAVIRMIGDSSYSLYLLHPFVVEPLQNVFSHLTSPLVRMSTVPVVLGFCIAAALVSYRLIERPSNEWLRARFIGQKER